MRENISRKSGKCTFETPKKSLLLPICFSTSERKFFFFQTQIINKETTTYYTTQISHFLHHFPDFLHYCYSCRSQLDFDYFLTIFPNLIYRFSRAKLKNSYLAIVAFTSVPFFQNLMDLLRKNWGSAMFQRSPNRRWFKSDLLLRPETSLN